MLIPVKTPMILMELMLMEFGTASKTTVKNMISHGNVRINGKMVTNPSESVKPGDVVEYTRQTQVKSKIKPPFPICFEDDCILVTEKPAGVLTIGDKGTGGTSFYKMMLEFTKERSQGRERLFVVHRLDREVSGLLVIAKSEEMQQKLKDQWSQTKKLYYALVEGHPPKESGTIKTWLIEKGDQRVSSVQEQEGAKAAITHYKVLDKTDDYSLLEVHLETGRKNQIRVHLSEMGCPVVGDRRYGADARFERRIRLHAYYLSFPHPQSGKSMEFKSKMPRGFLALKPENEKYK
jgi:23S rRNA pseudouridine1911/1915/1917 synthase